MATHKLLLLPGDGIGPEVMAEVKKLIAWMNAHGMGTFETEEGLVGGSCYDAHKVSITDATMAKAHAADAVIFGAVGGPKWDKRALRCAAGSGPAAAAQGPRALRQPPSGRDLSGAGRRLGAQARTGRGPRHHDPSRAHRRRLFRRAEDHHGSGNGQKRAIDTQVYDTYEIERIGRVAFELARKRKNKVTSMEKRNVMKTGVLWHEVITQLHQREFKDVTLEHQLADSGGMQLVRNPKQFDVVVTDNLFGDMLSDIAAMLTGSLGMLASASLGDIDPKTQKRKALYEPVHGSAPDIAGKGIANPIAMIASFGMGLRYSFNMGREADLIDKAIAAALAKGLRTADIMSHGANWSARRRWATQSSPRWRSSRLKEACSAVVRVVFARQEKRIGDRPARHDVVVRDRRRRIVIHVDEVGLVGLDVARHHLGAAVEIGALLHQDLGAGAAPLVAVK